MADEDKPPDVYGALTAYVTDKLGVSCYLDREPEGIAQPYVVLAGDFDTEWSFEFNWNDTGAVTFSCFAVGDDATRELGESVKRLFAKDPQVLAIPIADAQFVEVSRTRFGLHAEAEPDQAGNVVYRYDVSFNVVVNGSYES